MKKWTCRKETDGVSSGRMMRALSVVAACLIWAAGCAASGSKTEDRDGAVDSDSAMDGAVGADGGLDAFVGDGYVGSDGGQVDSSVDAAVADIPVPVREALLFYTGNRIPASSDQELWQAYLAYVNQDGTIRDTYFWDTYVFLDIGLIMDPAPIKAAWEHFLDVVFEDQVPTMAARRRMVQRSDVRGAALSDSSLSISQQGIPISGTSFSYEVWTRTESPVDGREALIAFVFRDAQGHEITSGVTGLTWSDYIGGKWYDYLATGRTWTKHQGSFAVPAGAASMDVEIRRFTCTGCTISVDRVQVVSGNQVLDYGDLAAAGFSTLVSDGDFSPGSAWTGFVAGEGLERALLTDPSFSVVAQGPISVQGGGTYTLSVRLRAQQTSSRHAGLLGIRIFDGSGQEITTGVSGMTYSIYAKPNMFYVYGDTDTSWTTRQVTFTLPAQAASLEVDLVDWYGEGWLAFDHVQLVEGSAALAPDALARAGYRTLLEDGSAEEEGSTSWFISARPAVPSGSGLLPSLARAALNVGDRRRRNVIIGIPTGVGFTSQRNFGEVGGRMLDLTLETDRLAAVTWFVQQAIDRWEADPPPGLDLVGFYWMHEGRSSDAPVVGQLREYLAARNKMLTGSPYRTYVGGSQCFGSSYSAEMASKFDRVWQQPNVWPPGHHSDHWDRVQNCLCAPDGVPMTYDMWLEMGYPPCELERVDGMIDSVQQSCSALDNRCSIHVNIEWVDGLEETLGHGRVLDYMSLDGSFAHDFGRFEDRMWYEAAGFGWRCAHDTDSRFREQYDAAFEFVTDNRTRHGFPSATP